MTPLVSIIVPSYNLGAYLNEALTSVLSQTYSSWECIIIDDGSTDETKDVALKFCRQDKRFNYIYQDNMGVIASRNNAIRHSCGKYILPLDADDRIAADYTEKAVQILENDDDVKIVYGDVLLFGATSGIYKLPLYSLPNLLTSNCISNTSFFRRSDFDRFGGYNPNMKDGWEDWDFWISVMENGGKVYKIPSIGHIYRIRDNSRNNSINDNDSELTNRIWKNHLSIYQQEFRKYTDITNSRWYVFFVMARKVKKIITSKN